MAHPCTGWRLRGLAAGVAGAISLVPRLAAPQGGPSVPVRIMMDQPRYAFGAHGLVTVRVGRDGYLLVLYADPHGHVRVAYPLDPGDDAAVRGGADVPIRSRGQSSAFTVEDSSGTGTWYAAISRRPFRSDSVAVDGHWDYRVVPRVAEPSEAERALTAFVERLSTGRFDYDIVQFDVSSYAATTAARAAPPSEPDDDPWWPGSWAGPVVGPWPWPWLPRPWGGPEPTYDRPLGRGAVVGAGSRPAAPAGSGGGEPREHATGHDRDPSPRGRP